MIATFDNQLCVCKFIWFVFNLGTFALIVILNNSDELLYFKSDLHCGIFFRIFFLSSCSTSELINVKYISTRELPVRNENYY